MKQSEIRVGGVYKAKVSNNIVSVRVTGIDERENYGTRSSRKIKIYRCTNLSTGREITIKSSTRFRSEVK